MPGNTKANRTVTVKTQSTYTRHYKAVSGSDQFKLSITGSSFPFECCTSNLNLFSKYSVDAWKP